MGFAGLMRLEAEAKNSSENERMRDDKCAEIRSIHDRQQCFEAAGMLGTIDQGLLRGGALELEMRGVYQCMWHRRCCLFDSAEWSPWWWTECPESFQGRVLGFPLFE